MSDGRGDGGSDDTGAEGSGRAVVDEERGLTTDDEVVDAGDQKPIVKRSGGAADDDSEDEDGFDQGAPPYVCCCAPYMRHIVALTRIFGLCLIIALIAAGVTTFHSDVQIIKDSGLYMIICGCVIALFESFWVFKLICKKTGCLCCGEGCCYKAFYLCVHHVDNWVKTVIYVALSIPLYSGRLQTVLGFVFGALMIFLGFLYLMKTFRELGCCDATRTDRYNEWLEKQQRRRRREQEKRAIARDADRKDYGANGK